MGSTDSVGSWVQDYATALKHGSLKPYSVTERKARAATRNQPWGPTGTELARLAEASHSPSDCATILHVVDLRLAYPAKKWRNVYKALTLLEYLLRHGSEACVAAARGPLAPRLESLAAGFAMVEPTGRDAGVNVRHRAQAILALLRDERRLAAEREAGAKKRGAYTGFSSYDVMAQGGPTGAGGGAPPPYGGWAPAAQDGGHLSQPGGGGGAPEEAQPGSAEYRRRDAGDDALRNAGETKGVSMEENARYLAALRRLLDMPANRACADCAGTGAGSRPAWASINCGVFLCMRCAGVHRGMGVHVSKVRSCSLDTWLPEQVEFMARTGNALAATHWEASMPAARRPPASATLQDLEAFARRKYVAREWAAGAWPPPSSQLADGPEVLAVLADCLPPERARELLGAQEAAAAAAAAAAEAERARVAATAINLIDFDLEPAAPAAGQPGGDALPGLEAALAPAAAPAGPPPPSQPAADLAGWDMGAQLAQAQREASQAAEAAAAAAAAQAAAAAPPRPAPYCPPWAPQAPAAPGDAANMQLVPAAAAFQPGFHSGGQPGGGGQPYAAQPSNNPFAPTAASYYASLAPRPQPGGRSTPPRAAPPRAAPASPAEAKAAELISRDLLAFNLHAETVSALHPPPRHALHGYAAAPAAPSPPLASLRSPGR